MGNNISRRRARKTIDILRREYESEIIDKEALDFVAVGVQAADGRGGLCHLGYHPIGFVRKSWVLD